MQPTGTMNPERDLLKQIVRGPSHRPWKEVSVMSDTTRQSGRVTADGQRSPSPDSAMSAGSSADGRAKRLGELVTAAENPVSVYELARRWS